MSYPGAAPPPAGVVADVDNPQDVLRTVTYVTQGLTVFFSTLFIAARLYSKTKVMGGIVSWDDYATYTSWVLMIGYCITACFMTYHGAGLNQWDVRVEDIQSFFKSSYAATIFYAPMALTVKLALMLIILRVFGSVHKKVMIGMYAFIGMIVIYYGLGIFIKIFVCWPISAYWHGHMENCLDQSAIITADAIISVLSDLVILLLPLPLTWSLQLPRKKRLRVIGMLCAGGVATGFSVYRLILILKDGKSSNQTIVFTKVVLSGNAEAGIGLICACLPAINALWTRKIKSSSAYAGYAAHDSRSGLDGSQHGGIMLTRSVHIHSSKSAKDTTDYGLGNDEAGLTSDIQANPHSSRDSNRSDSLK
ncbi:hypothetical protein VD0002_g2084 [Verticillium dahliae]|uniref:Integral membrane protein n=2 Tax=Verticillium dahliae TaxID=27337 RepID=G2X5F6_VERDV|nr:uncharacterized protein VDAG_05461 [Verticillium dahliae VdLs.17]KAF3342970.1 Cell fusion protein cfr1 [Verticillium dahliae VDG2]KAH6701050.1 integral membrane protein [Verticillium dahliae]EGY14297.1 integral membrane protein [Verticillium dahliae VdLs.17]PNH27246.1 hypothetical protein BJF96_g9427 [Verticillium dahliae]PNH53824.1 hypothetical protein VD0003_g3614 [Verticillium dahliae]